MQPFSQEPSSKCPLQDCCSWGDPRAVLSSLRDSAPPGASVCKGEAAPFLSSHPSFPGVLPASRADERRAKDGSGALLRGPVQQRHPRGHRAYHAQAAHHLRTCPPDAAAATTVGALPLQLGSCVLMGGGASGREGEGTPAPSSRGLSARGVRPARGSQPGRGARTGSGGRADTQWIWEPC